MRANLSTPTHVTIMLKLYNINAKQNGLSAEEYLLRQKGDWRGYIYLMNSAAIDPSPFFRKMMNYYAAGMKSFEGLSSQNGLLIGTSVWGVDYFRRFLNFCLPSLLEEKNLEALKSRNTTIFIHTDKPGKDIISEHPILARFISEGIQIQVMVLNDEVLELIETIPHAKYWHLGMTQSLHLQYAKVLGMDYHLMMPDMMYSSGYFQRLFSIKRPVITHGCLSVTEEIPIERNSIEISIPPDKLMSLALLHAHPRGEMHFVREKLPKSHLLIFEGKDELSIMSPHQSIAYMSKDVISKIPDRIFFTLDSELEKITDRAIYTPRAKDGLVMAEVSGKADIYARKDAETIEEYCKVFHQRVPENGLYGLFSQEMSFPVDRKMLGDRSFLSDEKIFGFKQQLRSALHVA